MKCVDISVFIVFLMLHFYLVKTFSFNIILHIKQILTFKAVAFYNCELDSIWLNNWYVIHLFWLCFPLAL